MFGLGVNKLGATNQKSFTPRKLFSNGEAGVWYDPSDITTLYQDSQGLTPVTAVGEPVGLMLDKSEGIALGNELVTNGDFSNGTTGWSSASSGVGNVVNGQLVITSNNPTDDAYAMSQSFAVVQGESYKVSANLVSTTGSNIQCRAGSTNTSGGYGTLDSNNSFGNVSMIVVPTTSTMWITLYGFGAGDSATFDNISVKKVSGSHATQSTSTKRPVFARHPEGGIRNLLNYTEQFDNGYWTKFAGATASGTTINLPVTDDRVYGGYTPLSNTAYTYSAILSGSGTVTLQFKMGGINIETQVTLTAAPTKHSLTVTTTSTVAGNVFIRKRGSDTATTLTCDGVQLEEATEASNYQKVVTDIDVTESGVGEVYYLKFDGVDDGMLINNLTSASTPLTALFGHQIKANNKWLLDIQSGRTVFGGNNSNRSVFDGGWIQGPPETFDRTVLTYDAVQADLKIRIDGTVESTSGAYDENSIGGQIGLFQSYAQSGSVVKGNMYQTILRAAESTDEEIAKAETFVANKTGLKAQVDGIATLDLNFGNNTYTAKNSNGGVI